MSWSDASMRRALAALLVAGNLATWAGGAQAGDDLWTTQGPISGNISGLAIDPTTPAILYAGAFGLGSSRARTAARRGARSTTG